MEHERMKPIVVGVDGSRPALAALEYATEEAIARAAPLVLVHALSGEPSGDDVIADGVARVRSEHRALGVTGRSVVGDPVRVLGTMAADAALLIVGHRGRGARPGRDAGSVAARLVGADAAPLLVYRPLEGAGEFAEPRPVLVGIDPAFGADALAEFGFAEAALRGAPLEVIWLRPPASGDQTATEALRRWSEKHPDVVLSTTTRYGVDAAIALAAASHSAQLVVVGTTSRPAAQWVARAVLDRAGCPIAIIPV